MYVVQNSPMSILHKDKKGDTQMWKDDLATQWNLSQCFSPTKYIAWNSYLQNMKIVSGSQPNWFL